MMHWLFHFQIVHRLFRAKTTLKLRTYLKPKLSPHDDAISVVFQRREGYKHKKSHDIVKLNKQ